ncbi:YvcK family protein [Candidatus Woesearchaeota archaeon]|nr:YvcK family protein [Candidatus Woesearchaeota archaeon]
MNVVVIGGGTGSYTVLKGLKQLTSGITAIVSMFDSGGSTGLLRDEFGVLPPGDVRRCLIALAEDETLRDLFQYRFKTDSSLHGHSLGNLFITALKHITGSDAQAIKLASRLLRIKGTVLPVTLGNAHLLAELEDGTTIKGETHIDIPAHNGALRISKLKLDPPVTANDEALAAIEKADLVVIGPGDLFTSVLPNLLVDGVSCALSKTKALKVYVCNLMTKFGETTNFTASEHLKEIIKYGCKPDVILCNNASYSQELIKAYHENKQTPVDIDKEAISRLGVELVTAALSTSPDLIRHDSLKLANALLLLKQKNDRDNKE